ncbi:hypothetical protein DRQ09_02995, partial [candidate division KSB1 bacterium]
MYKENFRIIILFITFLILIPSSLMGQERKKEVKKQNPLQQEYKIAQSYENIGEHKKALDIYRRLHKADPESPLYFNGMKRTMIFLKMYPELVNLLESRLKTKQDINLMGDLADAYYRWGKIDKAKELWNKIIETFPQKDFSYLYVSNLMVQNRLFEEAINLLLEGRKTLKNDKLFITNLGYLYYYRRDFKSATKEYIKLIKINPRLFNTVNKYLNRFPDDSTTFKEVLPVLIENIDREPGNPSYRRLIINLYMKHKKYEQAFNQYKILDNILNAKGKEILRFADMTLNEKEYKIAEEIYRYFINKYPSHKQIPKARFGLAYCYENIDNVPDDNKKMTPGYIKAIEEYKLVAEEAPESILKAEALYRIGEINFLKLFDLDNAINYYNLIVKQFQNTYICLTAFLRLGDVFIAKGDLENAMLNFNRVKNADKKSGKDLPGKARLKLAELEFFKGRIDSSLQICNNLLDEIPKNSDIYNDLLEFTLFLEDNKGINNNLINNYARAEFL